MIYERMIQERKRLEKEIDTIQAQLDTLPKGKIICARNANRYKWYHSDGHNKTYIPKDNFFLAEQLAQKKYLSLLSKDLLHEKNAIDQYYKHHATEPGLAEQLLTNYPEYQKLLASYFAPDSNALSNWMNSPYERNTKYPEQLIHKTSSGNLVRSKSEALIDMVLHTNKVPFRYECALRLGTSIIYPDFTIRHPHTGETYYWEHFGLMDDPIYSQNACSKLQLYISHDIIPSIHLITTYETKEHPLCSEIIEKIVAYYFL